MLVNFDIPLVNFHGEKITVDGKADAKVRDIVVNALLLNDETLNTTKKFKQYELAKHIHYNIPEVNVTIEDLALIKEVVGKYYPPLIVGLVFETLEEVNC